ncbi:MAG: hypothetical protein MJY41_01675 [Bacteroidales bacterium]|nr:hypothetical protein [Bacteroidales bacterium]
MKGKRIISTLVLLLLAWAFAPHCAAEPRVKFDHKSMNIHMDMNFRQFQRLERFMPASMKQEIADDYYPFIRKNIQQDKILIYKTTKALMTTRENGNMDITMEFPHYYLSFTDVCWEDMDTLFKKYFAQSQKINKFAVPTKP